MSNNETVHSSTALELGAAILQQFPRDITQQVALGWIGNNKALGRGLRELLMPSAEIAQRISPAILELIDIVDGDPEDAFGLIDFYKEEGQPDGIKFLLEGDLKANFLTGIGRIELNVPAARLNVYRLLKPSLNALIIPTLGGSEAIRTCLAYMAQLIRKQPKGQKEGVLLTDGWANIFYAEDDNGVLWSVYCYWNFDRSMWCLGAYAVTDPDKWRAYCQVFSVAAFAA